MPQVTTSTIAILGSHDAIVPFAVRTAGLRPAPLPLGFSDVAPASPRTSSSGFSGAGTLACEFCGPLEFHGPALLPLPFVPPASRALSAPRCCSRGRHLCRSPLQGRHNSTPETWGFSPDALRFRISSQRTNPKIVKHSPLAPLYTLGNQHPCEQNSSH